MPSIFYLCVFWLESLGRLFWWSWRYLDILVRKLTCKRQGGPKVLMTSKGLLKKPNSHSYLWLQKWFFSALHKNFLRKLYSKRDKITCIDIAVLDANVKKCYIFSAGSGTHRWNASRRNPIWFLVTSIISRSTLELCGMQSNKADWPAEQGTTRI